MNGYNLTLYDFVVDIIPGVFAILLGLSLLPAGSIAAINIAEVTVGTSVLIVVLGYFVGHLVQAVASRVDRCIYFLRRDEYPFEQAIAEAKSDSVEDKFSDMIDSFFGEGNGENDELSGYERFKLTQSYLWNNNIGRSQRFQILYTFLRSMWVLLVLGAILHLLGLIALLWLDYSLVWTPVQSGMIIVVLTVFGILAYLRRLKYHNMMIDALIYDFYANILTQQD